MINFYVSIPENVILHFLHRWAKNIHKFHVYFRLPCITVSSLDKVNVEVLYRSWFSQICRQTLPRMFTCFKFVLKNVRLFLQYSTYYKMIGLAQNIQFSYLLFCLYGKHCFVYIKINLLLKKCLCYFGITMIEVFLT